MLSNPLLAGRTPADFCAAKNRWLYSERRWIGRSKRGLLSLAAAWWRRLLLRGWR